MRGLFQLLSKGMVTGLFRFARCTVYKLYLYVVQLYVKSLEILCQIDIKLTEYEIKSKRSKGDLYEI